MVGAMDAWGFFVGLGGEASVAASPDSPNLNRLAENVAWGEKTDEKGGGWKKREGCLGRKAQAGQACA